MAEPTAHPPDDRGPADPVGQVVGGATYPARPPEEWPAWAPRSGPDVPVPPSSPPGRSGRIVAIAAAIVVALILLTVAGVAVSRSDDLEEAAPSTSATSPDSEPAPAPDPAAPSLPDLGGVMPDPEDLAQPLDAVLDDIIAFVERQRGHRFVTRPVVETASAAEFEQVLSDLRSDEVANLQGQQVALRALGIIERDDDLVEITERAGAAGVLGFYLPGDGTLLVKGDTVTPLVQTVIAHELTHALDDQLSDLTRLDEELAERDDEAAFGLLSVIEGTARWVEQSFARQMTPEEQMAVEAERLTLGIDQMLTIGDLPVPYLISTQVPYGSGLTLVSAIHADGGVAALDRAFEDPPTTSEQVLQPALYLARHPAVPVSAPTAEGEATGEGAFGAVDLRLMTLVGDLAAALGPASTGVVDPILGFGGGRFVSWEAGGQSCVRVHLIGDDAPSDEALRALVTDWSDEVDGDVTIESPGPGPDGRPLLGFRSCV